MKSNGNLFTAISIMLSTLALLYSWAQDRTLERREQANQVRSAAADTVARLQYWHDISLSLFDSVQTALVETSKFFIDGCSRTKVYEARDYLYKELHASRVSVQAAVRDQDAESAYVYLYGYHPSIRDGVLAKLRAIEQEMFQDLLDRTQNVVQRYLPLQGQEKAVQCTRPRCHSGGWPRGGSGHTLVRIWEIHSGSKWAR